MGEFDLIPQNEEERKEIVQDVVDRLLYTVGYKEALMEFNKAWPAPDLNRRLKSYREDQPEAEGQ